MNKTKLEILNSIESDTLRQIAAYLLDTGKTIIHFGPVWTKHTSNWIYFDTVLDVEGLKDKFQFNNDIIIHENPDPKSGTEKGFFDTITKEGLMGKLEQQKS